MTATRVQIVSSLLRSSLERSHFVPGRAVGVASPISEIVGGVVLGLIYVVGPISESEWETERETGHRISVR